MNMQQYHTQVLPALHKMDSSSTTSNNRKRPRTMMSMASIMNDSDTSTATDQPHVLPGVSQLLSSTFKPRQRMDEEGSFQSTKNSVVAVTNEISEEDEEDKAPWPSALQYKDVFDSISNGNIPIYDLGVDPRGVPYHPAFIYNEPKSCMYFLKCKQLLGKGSFGFPRKKKTENSNVVKKNVKGKKENSKDFEWRKMSFVTGLPKKQPLVRYITATCYTRATESTEKKKVFRMHAVMLADESGITEQGEYVLVHIRAGGNKRVGVRSLVESTEVTSVMEGQQTPPAPSTPVFTFSTPGRPVSPSTISVPSFRGTSTTSPRNKKLAHFSPTNNAATHPLPSLNSGKFFLSSLSSPRLPFSASEPSEMENGQRQNGVLGARQLLRDMILHSCASSEDVAHYVRGIQEELAAIQHHTN